MFQSTLEQIGIERLGRDHYRLAIPRIENRTMEVRTSLSADIDRGVCAIAPVGDHPVEIAGLPAAARHFFHIYVDGEHRGIVAHRHVPLEGTPNFRDFGGYTNREGRFVRWGRLYRSGMLSALSESDLEHFNNLGVGIVCDFRRDEERRIDPSRFPQQGLPRVETLPLAPGHHVATLKQLLRGDRHLTAADMIETMIAINREFVLEHAAVYGRLLRLLLETDRSALIHCAAGKDRTGFGAAVILSALDVPEEAVMRDYLLTGNYFVVQDEIARVVQRYSIPSKPEVIAPIVEARPEYLQAAFDSIRKEFGDMDCYLRDGLNFDDSARAELKARLLI